MAERAIEAVPRQDAGTGGTPERGGMPPQKKGLAYQRATMIQLQWHSTDMMNGQGRTRRRGAWNG